MIDDDNVVIRGGILQLETKISLASKNNITLIPPIYQNAFSTSPHNNILRTSIIKQSEKGNS